MLVAYFFMWYLFNFMLLLFALSGLDDFFIDIYFWTNRFFKKQKRRATTLHLQDVPEQYIAVLIPCWHEANVIRDMLVNNVFSINYNHYYLFVGVYPNDPDTVLAVTQAAAEHNHIQCVIGQTPGPTNKASNLNSIYQFVKVFEKKLPAPFQIFVFHDSEDLIHPLSFKLYNHYIPSHDMVQLPVFPLEVPYRELTHWLYADEFSEIHTKDIMVRQAIQAHVPSAGVGTAFSRHALHMLEDEHTQTPFSIASLTEDYRTSLALHIKGLKSIFVFHFVWRTKWVRAGFMGHRQKLKRVHEPIATRAFFPRDYIKAVRQKARWIIGIVFQEWDHTPWPRSWSVRYSLMHDRKAFVTHLINAFGYFVFFFWLIYSLVFWKEAAYPSLQEQLNFHPWTRGLMWFVMLMMLERTLQRMMAIYHIYGWRPLVLIIPRVLYGNVLNCHALLRAYYLYFSTPKQKNTQRQPAWDKTEHDFPWDHPLVRYRRRLGRLLLEANYITHEQLRKIRHVCEESGERFGEVALRLNYIDQATLLNFLAMQYDLNLINQSVCVLNNKIFLSQVKLKIKRFLEKNGMYLVALDLIHQRMTFAIRDPSNTLLIQQARRIASPYQVSFMLFDPDA